jgi:hypothetical protein
LVGARRSLRRLVDEGAGEGDLHGHVLGIHRLEYALFGTGFSGEPRSAAAALIDSINAGIAGAPAGPTELCFSDADNNHANGTVPKPHQVTTFADKSKDAAAKTAPAKKK